MRIGAVLILFASSAAAHAQVIEIDSTGNAQTFDRPTVFTANGALPIDSGQSPRATEPSGLLDDAASAHGIDPALMRAVAWQESRGRMSALSHKGAIGVMQLMPATAAELGVDAWDFAENVRGGAIYLRRQLDRFGSVPLALAAYNAGPGAVVRFGGIPPFQETRDYVNKIMGRWRPTPPRGPAGPMVSTVIEVPSL